MSNQQSASSGNGDTRLEQSVRFGDYNVGSTPWWQTSQQGQTNYTPFILGGVVLALGALWLKRKK